ncbi:alpha-L-rhamnosidase [Paenibacillus luteus]|uniref:alpha-L-rhamnosidase n=1 Tax=Paenibacillus luteus TaxID=2545753 RepID=UPI001141F145|nr:alpha-L-rhamnosidase [Paenibacillus luteus]
MMNPIQLRCNFLDDPIGIDDPNPCFSWQFNIKESCWGEKQTAFHIQMAESEIDLQAGRLFWDSNKIVTDQSAHNLYQGPELQSRQRIYWRVKIWDQTGMESYWSYTSFFEMGLLNQQKDWQAEWINPELETKENERYPASFLRKIFTVEQGFTKARLYITACGVYEGWLNGKRIGNQILAPGATNYSERLQYQTYDVTHVIENGDNAIGVILGDGWFRGRNGIKGTTNVFGSQLQLFAQLEMEYESGEIKTIITNDTWRATNEGPILFNDLQDGEIYDARKELTDWSKPLFDDRSWHSPKLGDWKPQLLVASNSVPIVEREQFTPKMMKTPDGNTVLDFGQNMTGYVQFSVKGPHGHQISLLHGETLDENGNFTLKNLSHQRPDHKDLEQKICYTLNGKGRESYKPRFTVHGFQYVLLQNWPEEVHPNHFTAIAVYSDLVETGDFHCSNDLVNQLVHNTKWSQKGNFVDIPTDCPQRERAGWTGDIQVFMHTGSLLMETYPFMSKWLKDVAAQQREDGMIYNITPRIYPKAEENNQENLTIEGSAGWGDAIVIVPWTLWKMYGNKRILHENWNAMKKWVDYQAENAKETHWVREFDENPFREYTWDTKFHWGEWAEPDRKGSLALFVNLVFSDPEVATAYYAYSSRLLAECAEALDKHDEAKYYRELSILATKAYVYNFTNDGEVHSKRQAHLVRPLALGLLPEDKRQLAADQLAQLVRENDFHIGTGFLSTPYICRILTKYGHNDIAYQLLLQTTPPSWLYAVTKGATTIWEHWESIGQDNVPQDASLNHYSFGAVVGWLFQCVAGINFLDRRQAENQFLLAPKPNKRLNYAKASYRSAFGVIKSEWFMKADHIEFYFEVPANTQAKIILPCQDDQLKILCGEAGIEKVELEMGLVCLHVMSGHYQFACLQNDAVGSYEEISEKT